MVSSSCKSATPPSGFGVDLTVDATSLPNVASITQLAVSTSGAETYTDKFDVTKAIAHGGVVRVRYVPGVKMGMLSFTVDALDASGTLVAEGAQPVTLVTGKAVDLAIKLVAPQVDAGPSDMLAAHCTDNMKDADETDIDCGGNDCAGCEPGKTCVMNTDCATANCVMATTVSQCELATGPPNWTSILALPIPGRAYAGAAGPSDGGIYVIGGYTTGIETSVLRYDLTMNAWTATTSMLTISREGLSVTNASDTLFAIGGESLPTGTSTTDEGLASIESWSETTPMWTAFGTALAGPRAYHASALGGNGSIYVIGGEAFPTTTPVNTVESFTPTMTGTATAVMGIPVARTHLAAAPDASGHVLAIGGSDATPAVSGEVDVLDTTTGMWSTSMAALGSPRSDHGAALGLDGRVYVMGGLNNLGSPLSSVEALSADGSHFIPIPDISAARADVAVTTGWDGRIYVIGGQTQSGPVTTVDAYGPTILAGPTSGKVGDAIALSIDNFAGNATVSVTFSGDPMGTVAVSGKTNAMGTGTSLLWHVPNVTPGVYTLSAQDDHSRYPVRTTFTVTD